MKRLLTVFAFAAITFTSLQSKAQAFDRSTKIINLGLGAADMFHIPLGYYHYYTGFYSPITGQLNVSGEFAVHKYVGVGFTTGIGGRAGGIRGGLYGPVYSYSGYYPEFNIPIGVLANFHFYQLIADKNKKNIHADKLDIYAGLSLGSGIAIHPGGYYDGGGVYRTGAFNDVLFFFSPQVGARYYFKPNIGVYGEIGWGRSLIQAGITFKMGAGKK
ncbi:MAG: hypothetical protein JWO03_1372 [Bacteroidetes bacterium]|nr:hypothetical protein [Bacteroidota bacterium]